MKLLLETYSLFTFCLVGYLCAKHKRRTLFWVWALTGATLGTIRLFLDK